DPFWRPESTTDETGVVTTFDYSPTSAESSITFNSGGSTVDVKGFVDALGREYLLQNKQGPSATNWDTVSITFDTNGRVYSTSQPCAKASGTPCPSSPATTQTYDALKRPL